MIIAISGLTGSGKTTIGDMVAKKLKIKHVSMTHKKFMPAGTALLKFSKSATPQFERNFDKEIVSEARMAKNSVVTTWLGPWLIKDAAVKVWLHASLDTRVKRKIKELDKPMTNVRKYVIDKDNTNRKRYKKIYNIDLDNRRVFDVDINTDKVSITQAADLIIALAKIKTHKK